MKSKSILLDLFFFKQKLSWKFIARYINDYIMFLIWHDFEIDIFVVKFFFFFLWKVVDKISWDRLDANVFSSKAVALIVDGRVGKATVIHF